MKVCIFLTVAQNFSDPNLALSRWSDLFLDVINKRALLKKKRIKHQILPPWLNTDIEQAMLLRDTFRKQKKFVEYKQQRNRVNYLGGGGGGGGGRGGQEEIL